MFKKLHNLFLTLIINLSEKVECWEAENQKLEMERKFYEEKHDSISELARKENNG